MDGQPRIQRLSDDAIAHILSGSALTGLASVVEGLLMNSFDADASEVTVEVNINRNSVIVEDLGTGIVPDDMPLLGNRYSTSKSLYTSPQTFGFRGEFLASLATSSYLTIYSRSRDWRSTHMIKFHYGIEMPHRSTQIENDDFMLRHSGTKVVVDRLFGNFPVRMVAREKNTAVDIAKEWKDIERKIAEVSLVRVKSADMLRVVLRDERGLKRIFSAASIDPNGDETRRIGQVMSSAGFGQAAWENVGSSWNGMTVKGVVGLAPVADTERQFIFVNDTAVRRHMLSVLYTKTNGFFAASSFGEIDESAAQANGKAFVARKGVERHPSFVLYVQMAGQLGHLRAEDLEHESGDSVQLEVLRLIESAVDGFLKSKGWRREGITKKRPRTVVDEVEEELSALDFWSRKRTDIAINEKAFFKMKPSGRSEARPLTTEDLSKFWSRRRADIAFNGMAFSRMKSSGRVNAESVVPKPVEVPRRPMSTISAREKTVPADAYVLRHQDPEADEYLLLDKRTGTEMLTPRAPTMPRRLTLMPRPRKPLSASVRASNSDLIVGFNNPVYRNPEAQIPRASMIMNGTPKEIEDINKVKISKEGLQTAKVLSQVDDKYILLETQAQKLLVLVDQHAADERVRVEKLWREYDNQPKPLNQRIVFAIPADEANVLRLHIKEMCEWGFDMKFEPIPTFQGAARVEVRGAQELVADRCVSDSGIIERLIREWIAELKEGRGGGGKFSIEWGKRMTRAPNTLSEVINSRACRSSIMFNDQLTTEECGQLIKKLKACSFPFQCAHGRPSMAPIVDLGSGTARGEFGRDMCGRLCQLEGGGGG